jgi:tetratricopeptide (TPR) repeat protein
MSTRQAQDKLDFYLATSQLLRPDDNLAGARAVLQRLAARPGASSAYRENVFAVAIQQLLGPSLHPLTGANQLTGERLLVEINDAVAVDENLANSNMLANRALLLLALQRPKDALDSVAAGRQQVRNPELELIAVLAKSGMGLRDEAMAILDEAISEFGNDDRFTALKNDLQAVCFQRRRGVRRCRPMSSIRAALQQLTELPPSQIGEILGHHWWWTQRLSRAASIAGRGGTSTHVGNAA